MFGTARRVERALRERMLRLEILETRALLSLTPPSGVIDPATSLMVRFKAGVPAAAEQAAVAPLGGTIAQSFPAGPSVVELAPGHAPGVAIGLLKTNPAVSYVESDNTIQATDLTPNDPYYPLQWGLNNGDNVDIGAPQAWSITTGSRSVMVAVLDTGIDLHNPDLTSRLWVNPTAGSDGFNNDVYGWNFVNNTPNVQDNNGHGSHVTGILAAAGNDGVGIAGVDWNAQIMPVKILGSDGSGTIAAAVAGIYFAVNHGAKVINASWGGTQYSRSMLDAINYANSRGVVFVTAAGNNGLDNDTNPAVYPANYRLPNEIVVAAVDAGGNLASFSNYGAHTVDLGAPGVDIFSTVPGGYATYSGTSMATPFVTGVVSLLAGLHPGLGASDLVQRVLASVKPLPSLAGTTVSGGMVDAYNALTFTPSPQGISANGFGGRRSVDDIASAILATDDTYRAFGGTPASYVAGLYSIILDRPPDPAGSNYYSDLLAAGDTRQDIIAQLMNTDEARRTEVAQWYQRELGWNAPLANLKVDPGVVYWAGLIDGGRSGAMVHAMILASGLAQGQSSTAFVSSLYETALGRPADPSGLDYYAGLIDQGTNREDVALQILSTDEAHRTEVAHFYQYELGWTSALASLKVDLGVVYWASLISS